MSPARFVEVITLRGDLRHLAIDDLASRATGRLVTICRAAEAWTIEAWDAVPDHPHLTPEEMHDLPMCPECADLSR